MEEDLLFVHTTSQQANLPIEEQQETLEIQATPIQITFRRGRQQKKQRSKLSQAQIKRRILLNKLKESDLALLCRQKQLKVLNKKLILLNNGDKNK